MLRVDALTSVVMCGTGYVADKDRWFCSACPAGKFSAAEGGEECQLCPAGKFSMDPGSKYGPPTCLRDARISTWLLGG